MWLDEAGGYACAWAEGILEAMLYFGFTFQAMERHEKNRQSQVYWKDRLAFRKAHTFADDEQIGGGQNGCKGDQWGGDRSPPGKRGWSADGETETKLKGKGETETKMTPPATCGCTGLKDGTTEDASQSLYEQTYTTLCSVEYWISHKFHL